MREVREGSGTRAAASLAAAPAPRPRLGLALAGGGFRASFFHLGVLRRMAELDLLRQVEVLSTVSGGSIVGALYVILLKRRLDRSATLTRDDFIAIVRDVQCVLVRGVQKNLRTRLLMNPFGILRVMLTHHSLGKRMARLYERHLYREAVDLLGPIPGAPAGGSPRRIARPGFWPLRSLRFFPGDRTVSEGLEAYNAAAASAGGVCLPNLILNATSLNSGRPFRLSSVEIGDPLLGAFRYDEIETELRPRKWLIDETGTGSAAASLAVYARKVAERGGAALSAAQQAVILSGFVLWQTRDVAGAGFELGPLFDAELGLLRKAKICAWYLTRGVEQNVDGGLPPTTHRSRLWAAIDAIDEAHSENYQRLIRAKPALGAVFLDAILQIYYFRTAERMAWDLKEDWEEISVADAVGASACFPPVFPPFIVGGLYDDRYIRRLGLSDGGVCDNVGITTLLEEECTRIVASDTGGLFEPARASAAGRIRMGGRIIGVLMDLVARLQRADIKERRQVARAVTGAQPAAPPASPDYLARLQQLYDLEALAFFHIASPSLCGARPAEAAARLRTDLDAFGDVEIAALFEAGYRRADEYLRAYIPLPDPRLDLPSAPPVATPGRADAERILAVGRYRFFRALPLGAAVSWVFTLVLAAGLIALALHHDPASGAAGAAAFIRWSLGLEDILLFGLPGQLALAIDWPWARAGLTAAGLAAVLAWLTIAPGRRGRPFAETRPRLATGLKRGRAIIGNLLWLAGLLPACLAVAGTVVAWASHWFYALPFLRATRDEGVREALSDTPASAPTSGKMTRVPDL